MDSLHITAGSATDQPMEATRKGPEVRQDTQLASRPRRQVHECTLELLDANPNVLRLRYAAFAGATTPSPSHDVPGTNNVLLARRTIGPTELVHLYRLGAELLVCGPPRLTQMRAQPAFLLRLVAILGKGLLVYFPVSLSPR